MNFEEVKNEVKEILLSGKEFFICSLIISIYVWLAAGVGVSLVVNLVLNIFSALIGAYRVMHKISSRIIDNSRRINMFHFDALINDTEELKIINKLLKYGDSQLAQETLEEIIASNSKTINDIKYELNVAEQET
jgi:hypothetical protein